MKRILISVLGGILTLILLISIGLILRLTGNLDIAIIFIKYTVGWSMYMLHFSSDFNYSNDIGPTSEIYKSWLINIAIYSLLIYLILSLGSVLKPNRINNK